MGSQPLISIIIPVYNVEKFLAKCLDSIVAQTYTNWEAILVNDGSPDNCGRMCDEYAEKDRRFKVIHQKNGGVSVARQTGLDNATGDYIIHCDPDDWVERVLLEDLLDCATSNDADMVICDIKENNNGNEKIVRMDLPSATDGKTIQRLLIEQKLHGSCCNKLIRAEHCKEIKFSPKEICLSEDELYNIRLLNNNIKVCYLPKALYIYRISNEESLCHSSSTKVIESKTKIVNELEKLLVKDEYNNFIALKETILRTMFTNKLFKEMKVSFPEIHQHIIDNNKRYRFHFPFGYFLAMALKGRCHTAHFLYKTNMHLIKIGQNIKKQFSNIDRHIV